MRIGDTIECESVRDLVITRAALLQQGIIAERKGIEQVLEIKYICNGTGKSTISEVLEITKAKMCDDYCKYPAMAAEQGLDIFECEDSPCLTCPLNSL